MKIQFYAILGLCGIVSSAQAQVFAPISSANFTKTLLNIRGQAAAPAPLPRITPERTSPRLGDKEAISAQLDQWLGVFDGFQRQPAMDAKAMSDEVTAGLESGRYKGLIMGESHGTQAEFDAGIMIVKDVLAGHGIGAFSRERETFPDTGFLEAAGVPVLTFKNQFKPDPDVQAGFSAARRKLLVTYTGHAHTSVRLKDYFVFTLLEGKPFGYVPGGKDMPTVEESFLAKRKKPVIVAMLTEARVLRRVEQLFLRKLAGDSGVYGGELLANLRIVRELWEKKVLSYPVHKEDIYFARSPEQDNLFAGITPGERKPLALDAVLQVLTMPEFTAWLGSDKIRIMESLWGSDSSGVSYRVVAHKFNGETFEQTVRGN